MWDYLPILILGLVAAISASDPTANADENETILIQDSSDENGSGFVNKVETLRREKFSEAKIEETFGNCEKILKDRDELEKKLAREHHRVVRPNDRTTDISLIRSKTHDPLVRSCEESQWPFEEASYQLYQEHNLSSDEINDLATASLNGQRGSANRNNCLNVLPTPQCNSRSKYRTADGTCNNLDNPRWGSTLACQQRLLQPYYLGNSELRRAVNSDFLPSPRSISRDQHPDASYPTTYVTHMYMFYGQLLDHDITLTPMSTTVDNQPIQCCPTQNQTHPQCRPIEIPRGDRFFSQFNVSCINFVRSAICPTCLMGPRQQMNQVTSFIDASFVYDNSDTGTRALREDNTGRLRVQRSRYGDLLPSSPNPDEDQCSFPDTNDICFQAGDSRANQHKTLTSLHTVFMREHNRLVDRLSRINPRWSAETLFQEARRIVGAYMQVITYKEFLPVTLTQDRMDYFELNYGDWTNYDRGTDPTMISEFTTAAFRLHTMINSIVTDRLMNGTNQVRLLRDEFFQPFELRDGIAGPLLRGVSDSPAQLFDNYLASDVTDFLYRIRGQPTGLDLAAINIQRGRDHGMPPYIEMVNYCSKDPRYNPDGIRIRNFDHLHTQKLMTRTQANSLTGTYRNVQDIDLWTGMVMETPDDYSVVGPTMACVIGIMFHHLKFGDRFYFEHRNQAGSFTYQQLKELSKVTLSQIICLNTDAGQMPREAMVFRSQNNPMIDCSRVTGIDLSYWRE